MTAIFEGGDSARPVAVARGPEHAFSGLLWALLALVAATAIALGGVAFFAAERFEHRDRAREKALAESALRAELSDMTSRVKDMAWWDEAIENLVANPNDFWADDNIGSYLFADFEISIAIVLRADGTRGFTFIDGEDKTDAGPPDIAPSLLSRLYEIANHAPMEEPDPVAFYARGLGETLVLSAAALTNENPTEEQLVQKPRPVLVLGRRLSGPFQVDVAEHYLLQDAGVVFEFSSEPQPLGLESVPIAGPDGQTAGYVVWKHDPGASMFRTELTNTVLLAILALAIVGMLFGLYLWRTRRMAHATTKALGEERRLLDERTHLLTTIAHDLKTPLTAMQAAVDLLLHFNDRMSDEEKRNELSVIQDRIGMMDGVISDALSIGSQNGHTFAAAAQDPAEGVRQLWFRQRPPADRGLLLTDVRPDRSDEMIDRSLFDQAVGNVLSNAVKYGEDATPVRVRLSREGNLLAIAISNPGRGVPEDEVDRLTEAFFRASNSGSITGVGLGLSIASRAAAQHGGGIAIEGVEGESLTVTVTLRVSDEDNSGAAG